MPQNPNLDPSRTAMLIMDIEPGIVANYTAEIETFFLRLGRLADAARAAKIQVIYVIVSFRPGHPEIGSQGQFKALKTGGRLVEEQVHLSVAPHEGEPVVIKKRVSAFTGSDLEVILRANDIKHLVLTGISTSGVVLSTLRQAADADYQLTVISDCCLDRDPEVHSVLTGKIFPSQATVTLADEFIATLNSAG